MVHTSEKAFKWTSDLQNLQAPKRPNDASEMAERWFKSHVREEPGKQKPRSCRAQELARGSVQKIWRTKRPLTRLRENQVGEQTRIKNGGETTLTKMP
jgi:hypothetical protein